MINLAISIRSLISSFLRFLRNDFIRDDIGHWITRGNEAARFAEKKLKEEKEVQNVPLHSPFSPNNDLSFRMEQSEMRNLILLS